MSVLAATILASAFQMAQPVWPTEKIGQTNVNVRFSALFVAGGDNVLRVAGADAYRVMLNGDFIHYGPVRAAQGFFRVDEISLPTRVGTNEIEIVAQGNNVACNCFARNAPFLQAEVVVDGSPAVVTDAEKGGFAAETTARVQRMSRYSDQRAFSEYYRMPHVARRLELSRVPERRRYLRRLAPFPTSAINESVRPVMETGICLTAPRFDRGQRFDDVPGGTEWHAWEEALHVTHPNRRPMTVAPGAQVVLKDGGGVMFDAGLDDCGFALATVEVRRPGRLLFDFDEVLTGGDVIPGRMSACNHFGWDFSAPGTYAIETFEPIVWRYAVWSAVKGGEFVLSNVRIRTHKNGQTGRAAFRCSDPALEKIFLAAKETFAQNAVDLLTDCPSRERAGYPCDGFFTGRVNKLLCGDVTLERLFLENFALPESFKGLPNGVLPMCYPAAHPDGTFIPNWPMWLILEAEEYLSRSGDRATIDALKRKFLGYVDYLNRFRNADGLLEKLPQWVFVEWSHANDLVQDVSYPSNMTWAEALDALGRLYEMPELTLEAARIRETVRRQSWTGRWFCDNAVRQADGMLKLSGDCTETCQYYAFFFRVATPESYPELWKTLVDEFGPKRKLSKRHPEIAPSNAFIGNYLRLELLSRAGLVRNILDETKEFFLFMAERTGTLWEHDSPYASCCHGFASHAVVYLYRDVLGVKSIDAANRRVVVDPPADVGFDWCEGTIPVSDVQAVTVRWKRGERPEVGWHSTVADR